MYTRVHDCDSLHLRIYDMKVDELIIIILRKLVGT